MAQDYGTPASAESLSDSHQKLVDSLDAVRSNFEGATAPSAPVDGQPWFNSTLTKLTYWDGAAWITLGIASAIGFADLDADLGDFTKLGAGSMLDTASVSVASDGATITLTFEKSGGGDVRTQFSTGVQIVDCTPAATIALTAGTDSVFQRNYVYIPESTGLLTLSTTGWPVAEHAKVADLLCQTAATLQTKLAHKNHVWTDHLGNGDGGHMAHVSARLRRIHADWVSGVVPTLTITTNGGSADNVVFTSSSGVVMQLHEHDFPAFTGTPDVYVKNHATPYTLVTDLNGQLTDTNSGSLSGRRFSLVIWGVVSEATGECKLYCSLPSGSYNSDAAVIADSSKFADYAIPNEFRGTGFLIMELKLRHQTSASGTWTSVQEVDLRGTVPSNAAGAGAAGGAEFFDGSFKIRNTADETKSKVYDLSGVTTGQERTATVADRDIDENQIQSVSTSPPANPVNGQQWVDSAIDVQWRYRTAATAGWYCHEDVAGGHVTLAAGVPTLDSNKNVTSVARESGSPAGEYIITVPSSLGLTLDDYEFRFDVHENNLAAGATRFETTIQINALTIKVMIRNASGAGVDLTGGFGFSIHRYDAR